jgi:serine/threonine-protein kinase RsbW
MAENPAATGDALAYARPDDLTTVRAFVRARALTLGLPPRRADLLTLAVSELATNTLQHAAGGGRIRIWAETGRVVCDVEDHGTARPFAGMPPADSVRGRGLAIVERVGDDVATSTVPGGTRVRIGLNL